MIFTTNHERYLVRRPRTHWISLNLLEPRGIAVISKRADSAPGNIAENKKFDCGASQGHDRWRHKPSCEHGMHL
jgi:hypothetical protein